VVQKSSTLPGSSRPWWFRGHPRWAALGALSIVALVAGVGEFLWLALPFGSHDVPRPVVLPTLCDEDRFFVEPVLANGAKLKLLTDTGGGTFLSRTAVDRCRLESSWAIGRGTVVRLDNLRSDAWIPEPVGGQRSIKVVDSDGDGMLGQRWFAGGVWTFDYPGKRLVLSNSPFQPTSEDAAHAAPLGFPTWMGLRSGNHPRITVVVGGQSIDTLFDTGATVRLTKDAMSSIGDGRPSERATSFAAATLFDRWRREHPEWRFIERAEQDSGSAMIEVSGLEIAGMTASPAWFTRREDASYQWMSSFMDQPIVASIGGNVLKGFRVIVDYPAAVAYFDSATN
jgi:hypothetical protein